MDEFDFVALGGVDEGHAVAVGLHVGAVGEGDAVRGEVAPEGLETVDLKGEVGEVGLDLDWAAVGEIAELDGFLAFGGFEEDQFGAAGRFVATDFLEPENIAIEPDGSFQIVHSVAGVEQFESEAHGASLAAGGRGGEGVDEVGAWDCEGLVRPACQRIARPV